MSDESFDAVEAVLCNDIEKIKELILDENIDVSNAIKFASSLGKYEILKTLLEHRGYEPFHK